MVRFVLFGLTVLCSFRAVAGCEALESTYFLPFEKTGEKGKVLIPMVRVMDKTRPTDSSGSPPRYSAVLEQDEDDWRLFRLKHYSKASQFVPIDTSIGRYDAPIVKSGVYGQATTYKANYVTDRIAFLYDMAGDLKYADAIGERGIYAIEALPGKYRLCVDYGLNPVVEIFPKGGSCTEVEITPDSIIRCDMDGEAVDGDQTTPEYQYQFNCRNEAPSERLIQIP